MPSIFNPCIHTIEAKINCKINLKKGDKRLKSSMKPKQKNKHPPVRKAKIIFMSRILCWGKIPIIKPIKKEEYSPINIDKPPSLTVGDLCNFLLLGKSRNPFFFENLITEGIEKYDIKKENNESFENKETAKKSSWDSSPLVPEVDEIPF